MRIGLISDIHSNYIALKTVLDFLKNKIDVLVCTGDFVGYGPSPIKCIEILRDFPLPHYFCLGNHDLGVRYRYSCNINSPLEKDFKIISRFTFSKVAEEMIKRNANELKEDHFEFLSNLPFKQTIKIKGFNFYITHGTPSSRRAENVGKYVFPPPRESYDVILRRLSKAKYADVANLVFVGHSHQRFLIETDRLFYWSLIDDIISRRQIEFPLTFSFKRRRVLLNPGSVGQPRDGSGNASFVIIDLDRQEIEFHDLDYSRETFYKRVKRKCAPEIQDDTFWANRFGQFSKKYKKAEKSD